MLQVRCPFQANISWYDCFHSVKRVLVCKPNRGKLRQHDIQSTSCCRGYHLSWSIYFFSRQTALCVKLLHTVFTRRQWSTTAVPQGIYWTDNTVKEEVVGNSFLSHAQCSNSLPCRHLWHTILVSQLLLRNCSFRSMDMDQMNFFAGISFFLVVQLKMVSIIPQWNELC